MERQSEVINCFSKILGKSKHTFIVFDIEHFYSSISKYLLQKTLNLPKTKVVITQNMDKKRERAVWFGLNLIIKCSKTTVNYLGITLNVLDGIYKPYRKPENTLLYVYEESNHLPNIIKQSPITTKTRLSKQFLVIRQ